MPVRAAWPTDNDRSPIAVALQSAGLLSALIFMISSIYEVLVINNLHASQRFLIGLLLGALSVWAFLEIATISRRQSIKPLQILNLTLAVQIGLIAFRHWQDFRFQATAHSSIDIYQPRPEFGLAILFMPIYLVLFLAISRCIIEAFAHAERVRANQLQQQMLILGKTKAELEASEQRYRLIADHVNDVIWTIDANGKVGFVSPSLRSLIGRGADELIGQPFSKLLAPASAAILEAALQERLHQASQPGFDVAPFRAELEHLHQDGSSLWTEITMNSLRDQDGRLVGFVGVTRDIRSRKLYELNLREARDAAEEANLALLSANALLHGRATTDMLTGVFNRSHFEDILMAQMEKSSLHGEEISLLIIDVDNFKSINDNLGHGMGDQILVEVTRLLISNQRKFDQLARWGGDEFIMMLPRTGAQEALQVAKRLCTRCAVHPFPTKQRVTLSIGAAELNCNETMNQWFDRADRALYAVKKAGRNEAKLSD